jgi:hypothetical protein
LTDSFLFFGVKEKSDPADHSKAYFIYSVVISCSAAIYNSSSTVQSSVHDHHQDLQQFWQQWQKISTLLLIIEV